MKTSDIRRELFNKKNLEAMRFFADNCRVIYRLTNKLERVEKQIESKGLRAIAALLKLKTNQIGLHNSSFATDSTRDYHTKRMLEEGIATKLFQKYMSFDGKKLEEDCSKGVDVVIIKGKKTSVSPWCVEVKYKGLTFLMLVQREKYRPGGLNEGVAGYSLVFDKEKQIEVLDAWEELLTKYDPIKNNVVTYGNGFEIVDLHEKFSMEHIVVTKAIREEINLVASMFRNFDHLREQNVAFKRGILLSGPPGTGKTTAMNALAKAVTANGGTVIIIASTSNLALDNVYKFADKFKPSLVVLEDFDLIAGNRYGTAATTSVLLNVLEGNLGVEGVITVATTNRLDVLDQAATRHGRIDRIYPMSLPDYEMKKALLRLHLDYYKVETDKEEAVKAMDKFLNTPITGAVISSVVLGSKQRATVERREVTCEDLIWSSVGSREEQMEMGFKKEAE